VGGQDEAAFLAGAGDLDDAADRLLLEPLAGVALVGLRRAGQLGGGHPGGAGVAQRAVPAEPVAEHDADALHEAEDRAEDAPGERLGIGGRGRHGVRKSHGTSSGTVVGHGPWFSSEPFLLTAPEGVAEDSRGAFPPAVGPFRQGGGVDR
jgi:hypothetical protein